MWTHVRVRTGRTWIAWHHGAIVEMWSHGQLLMRSAHRRSVLSCMHHRSMVTIHRHHSVGRWTIVWVVEVRMRWHAAMVRRRPAWMVAWRGRAHLVVVRGIHRVSFHMLVSLPVAMLHI